MKHFSRKLATAIIAVCLYIGLYYVATTTSSLSPTIRFALLGGLPLISTLFTIIVLLYSVWATAKYRNTSSLLLVIMSLFVSVFLVPIWLIIAQQHYTFLKTLKQPKALPQQLAPASKETPQELPASEPTVPEKPEQGEPQSIEQNVDSVVVEQHNDAHNVVIGTVNKGGKVRKVKSKKELDTLVKQNPGGLIFKISADKWCEPCKEAKPIYEKAARKFGGDIPFFVADHDTFSGASSLKVQEVPTFIVYKRGKEVKRFTFKGADKLEGMLEKEVQALLGN